MTTHSQRLQALLTPAAKSNRIYLLLFLITAFLGVSLTLKHLSFEECSIQQNKPAIVNTSVIFTIGCPDGEAPRVAWDFGDGTGLGPYTNQTTITHTFQSTGTFNVFARIEGEEIPMSTVQTIVEPLTPVQPEHSSTIVIDTTNNTVWNVNADNNTITAINALTLTKKFESAVGVHPRTLALENNGNVWVTNEDDATISVIGTNGSSVRTINLPYASRPYGICFNPQGTNGFVTLSGTGKLVKLNPVTGQITGEVSTGPSPRGIAISSDGNRIFVTRFISPENRGEITEVNALSMTITRVIPLAFDNTPDFEDKGRGVPNYISSITISPNGKSAWIPSKKDNVARGQFRDGLALTFESTVRTIVSKINLQTNQEDLLTRLDINDADMANAVAFSPYGNLAFIALQGNNKIHIRDVQTNAFIGEIQETGLAPQGLVFNKDGSRLFVQNFMSRTVRVYDTESMILGNGFSATMVSTVATVSTEKLSAEVLKGKQIFYNAADSRMTSAGYISCASCHLDGGSDQRVWDFTDRGEGFRKTISLNGRRGIGMGNVHWTGNFDEIQDFENDIRTAFGGRGFMSDADYNATRDPLGPKKAGRSIDLDALMAYVSSLTTVHPSPYKNTNGTFTSDALQGRTIFANLNCGSCHSGSDFTDRRDGILHDVGTIRPSSGKRINQPLPGFMTPTLKGIWGTAPYLHDGSAATLRDVLTTRNPNGKHGNTASLSATEMNQLIAYLNQLDDVGSCTNQTITLQTIPDKNTSDPAFAINATATSGLPVVYSILSGPATISGNTITLTGNAGTVIVAANQGGNTTYCSATQVTKTFQVTVQCAGVPSGVYKLINKGSGKALDNNGSRTNGTFIVQRSDNASANTNQQWLIEPAANGYFKLTNKTGGRVLDNAGSVAADAKMIQMQDNGATSQQWLICKLPNGAYKIVSRISNMALDNAFGSGAEANSIIQWPDDAVAKVNQQWDIIPVTENTFVSGVYKITARHSGRVLDVAGGSVNDDAIINQWDSNNGSNQKWKIENTGNGYYSITASHSEKSLQVPDSSQADNVNIFQRTYTNKDHQKWIIREVGNGYYEFVAKHSGKTLAVSGAATGNGARIVQLGTGGAMHQQWRLERLETPTGPGLGNLQYNSNELFKNIWLYTDPTHYGSNIAIMHNGYLVTTFTPDSGRPPGGIMIWNVSNPRAPVLVKRIYDERTASLREAHSIGQHGNYIALQEGCGIQIWDLSDVQNPLLVKRFCIPGYAHDDYGSAWQLFWQAPYIYIGNGSSGFDVVDATDIRNPVYIKHVNIGAQAGPIFAIGNLLITSAHNTGNGYAVTDISDPRNPKLLNRSTSGENIYASFVNGNRMIGSSRGNSDDRIFSVYDFSDPQNIRLAGKLNIGNSGSQLYCSTQDQFIFQGCQDEIVKINATNPAQMTIVGRASLNINGDSDHGQVTPMGNLIFVGNDHGSGNGFIVHQTAPDNRGPQVSMISPSSNAVNRAVTSRIGMSFTDNIDLRSVNASTFIVRPRGGAALSGRYSHQFSIVNFTPDQPLLPNTVYDVELPAGGIKDWSGNAIAARYTSTFTTGAIANCVPTAITPYVQVNDGTWQQTTTVIVSAGSNVRFGPQPIDGGSWRWSGPNGFNATSREAVVSNIQSAQVGNYIATYTDVDGCISTVTFKISLNGVNQPPSVSITSPANNTSYNVPASVTINANANDSDGTITKVDFYNGTSLLGTDNASPYSFVWNNVSVGNYNITARATDNAGAVTVSSTITVIVNAGCTPTAINPYVQVNGGAWANTNSATLNAGGSVMFGPQPVSGGSWNWTGPNNFTASTREVTISNIQTNQAGNYVARYTNAAGCVSTTTFTVTVNGVTPNVPPIVSIISPANNTSYNAPAVITINANASDSDGNVTKVDFYNGASLLGTDNTSPYSFTWNNVAAGTYMITARATDNAGAVTTSAGINIQVNSVSTNNCTGIPQYVENNGYVAGSLVQNAGSKYTCKPFPYSGWCNGAAWAYAPGTGSYWGDAWTLSGSCSAAKQSNAAIAESIQITPNPVESGFMLTFLNANTAQIELSDLYGKSVMTVSSYHSGENIFVSDLPAGTYVVRIITGEEVYIKSFVKK